MGSDDGNVYCLNADTGTKVWNYTCVHGLEGVRSSPAVAGGVVYVGSFDYKIYAFGPLPVVPEFSSYLVLPLFAANNSVSSSSLQTETGHKHVIKPARA